MFGSSVQLISSFATPSAPIVVLSTCANTEEARRIGKALVEESLAACVQIAPGIASIYRWEGKVVEDHEVLLLLKTTASRWDALRQRILALHSYQTPELLVFEVSDGSPAYLAWLVNASQASEA